MAFKFEQPSEVQAAADSGDVRAMLVATRSQIARALDAAGTSKNVSSVAALSKQLLEVQARIDALENTA